MPNIINRDTRPIVVSLLLFSVLFLHALPAGAVFTDIEAGLTGVENSTAVWGDYDNDGDLDILLAGYDGASITKLYRNDDSDTFTEVATTLLGVQNGFTAWGDYDNDGDLDILLAGDTGSGNIARVYRNDGGAFTDISAGLTGVSGIPGDWGDYDNDGDLDILLAGNTGSEYTTKVYRNDGGGTFTAFAIDLVGAVDSRTSWEDYDNDGNLDIIAPREAGSLNWSLYYNSQGTFYRTVRRLQVSRFDVPKMFWGDYDNDGDLDIAMTGQISDFDEGSIFNNDRGFFINTGFLDLCEVKNAWAAWGDYDNDGDLDLLLTGRQVSYPRDRITNVYRNNGDDTFTDIGAGLPGGEYGSAAWGDYDNDGDLDILLTGLGDSERIAGVWRNDGGWDEFSANNAPSTPTSLKAEYDGTTVILSWDAASDDKTPAGGLSYNIRAGTASGSVDVASPMTNPSTGYRLIPDRGAAGSLLKARLAGIDTSVTHYWSVQAVDTTFAGSAWAAEDELVFRELTTTKSGSGSGSVNSIDARINCGSICSEYYLNGDTVALQAAANGDSVFSGWTGDCSGTGACTVTMDAARTVDAVFETVPSYLLTVSATGAGSGTITSSPGGIYCGATCAGEFAHNSNVILTAAAVSGSKFAGWSGGGCTGTGSCSVTMNSVKTVAATFVVAPTYTLTVSELSSSTGSGIVTSDPPGIECASDNVGDCSQDFTEGTTVTLIATHFPGDEFGWWAGVDCCYVVDATVVTMDQDRNVEFRFEARYVNDSYGVFARPFGDGSGTITSDPVGIDCTSYLSDYEFTGECNGQFSPRLNRDSDRHTGCRQ